LKYQEFFINIIRYAEKGDQSYGNYATYLMYEKADNLRMRISDEWLG